MFNDKLSDDLTYMYGRRLQAGTRFVIYVYPSPPVARSGFLAIFENYERPRAIRDENVFTLASSLSDSYRPYPSPISNERNARLVFDRLDDIRRTNVSSSAFFVRRAKITFLVFFRRTLDYCIDIYVHFHTRVLSLYVFSLL